MTYSNLWENLKAVLWGKLIVLSAYMKLMEDNHMRELTAHLKAVEQNEASSLWRSRCQGGTNLGTEINKVEARKIDKESK